MRKKTFKITSITITAVLGVFGISAYLVSPYLTISQMKNAIKEKDGYKLSKYIDFENFRSSVKSQMKAKLAETAMNGSAGEAFGAIMVANMVDGLVETYVNPDNLDVSLKEGDIQSGDLEIDINYINVNTFRINTTNEYDEPISVDMKRKNLFSWKVKTVDLSQVDMQ